MHRISIRFKSRLWLHHCKKFISDLLVCFRFLPWFITQAPISLKVTTHWWDFIRQSEMNGSIRYGKFFRSWSPGVTELYDDQTSPEDQPPCVSPWVSLRVFTLHLWKFNLSMCSLTSLLLWSVIQRLKLKLITVTTSDSSSHNLPSRSSPENSHAQHPQQLPASPLSNASFTLQSLPTTLSVDIIRRYRTFPGILSLISSSPSPFHNPLPGSHFPRLSSYSWRVKLIFSLH